MAAPTGTWTAIDTADWDAGDGIYVDKLLLLLQDIQYLYDQISAVVSSNYWALFEQRLQNGLVPGGPFA